MIADDAPPPIPDDFGFNHSFEYVMDTAQWLLLSDFRILERAGGSGDQTSAWTDDMFTFLHIRSRLKWEKEHGAGDSSESVRNDMLTRSHNELLSFSSFIND